MNVSNGPGILPLPSVPSVSVPSFVFALSACASFLHFISPLVNTLVSWYIKVSTGFAILKKRKEQGHDDDEHH
jgi:hypothetical protein